MATDFEPSDPGPDDHTSGMEASKGEEAEATRANPLAPAGSGPDTLTDLVPPESLHLLRAASFDRVPLDTGPESGPMHRPQRIAASSVQRDRFGDTRPRGILVVEADPDLQWRLARMLTVEGNRVVGTSSGDGALALVERWPVDLVLVSEELPGMEGLEVIRHLHDALPELVSVLMAEELTEDLHAASRMAGASACIRKPRDIRSLERVLATLPLAGVEPSMMDFDDHAESSVSTGAAE